MAFLPDCQSVSLSAFNGAFVPSASALDATNIPLTNGRLARNCQYFGAGVSTRYGHSLVFSPADRVSAMANWLFLNVTTPMNYLAWHKPGTGIRAANLLTLSPSTIATETTSATASICPLGSRLYLSFMDANGVGVAPGQVYSYGAGSDPLFAAPIATLPVMSEIGSNATTLGPKNFGYLIQTRNGYITRGCPAPSSDFTPVNYTSAGGAILMTIDPPGHIWPDYALNVAPIMTTTANPNLFFIVPSPFPGASPWTAVNRIGTTVLLIDITDSVLEVNGTDATPYLNQFGQTVSGGAPFSPSVIVPYGQRLGYFGLDTAGVPVVYFSDLQNYQSINAATSGVYLPGLLQMTTGFSLRSVFYILGPHWTYSVSDSGDVPATWAQPQLIDGAIGALGPFCVSVTANSNFAWVADEAGLYLFEGGSYPSRPISYWQQPDWQRINFAQKTKIFVNDDKANQRVTVLAPLDGATSPTHELTWDYSLGTTPEQVQYSLNDIASYSPGAIAMVQNSVTNHLEKWLGPSDATMGIIRQNDSTDLNPYRDVAAAIDSEYEYAPVPRGKQGQIQNHQGANFRIRGVDGGSAQLTIYSLDQRDSVGPINIALDSRPDAEIMQPFFLRSEFASGRIKTNVLDAWFNLSRVDHYYTGGMNYR